MDTWTVYFSITSGAASGLTGLIFVGLSVNLQKIFAITREHLPGRTFGSLILLTNVFLVSNLCLVPKQSIQLLGIEIFILASVMWIIISRLDWIVYKAVDSNFRRLYFRNIFFSQGCIVPFLTGAAFLIHDSNAGFYILVPGVIFSFVKTLVDIWFLIVDINK